jgi:hypothetical protein
MSDSVECSVVLAQDGVKMCVLTGDRPDQQQKRRENFCRHIAAFYGLACPRRGTIR